MKRISAHLRHRCILEAEIMVALLVLFVCGWGRAWANSDSGRSYKEISGSARTLYPVAVAPVAGGDRWGERRDDFDRESKIFSSVVERDLRLIGSFAVISRGFFPADAGKAPVIEAAKWRAIGAQAVITSLLEPAGDRGISLSWKLFETATGKGGAALRDAFVDRDARSLGHRVSDAILRHFTGRSGPFFSKIAFAAGDWRSGRSHIYIMDYDGFNVRRVSTTGNQNILPSLGPGKQLIWTSYLWRNPDLYHAVVNGRARRISKRVGLNSDATFSRNGREIALALSRDGDPEIYVINSRGRVLRRLTHDPAIDISPSYSPDGSRIAFVSNRAGSPQIYVMSASGGPARRLTFAGNYNQEPDWCPTAGCTKIAFSGRDSRGNYDIFLVDAADLKISRLTQDRWDNQSPSWSPDGRMIVFASSRGGLYAVNADGTNLNKIVSVGRTPSWR